MGGDSHPLRILGVLASAMKPDATKELNIRKSSCIATWKKMDKFWNAAKTKHP